MEHKPLFVYRDGKVYLADIHGNPEVTFIQWRARVKAMTLKFMDFPASIEVNGSAYRICLDENCTVAQAAIALSGEPDMRVLSFPPHAVENIQVIS